MELSFVEKVGAFTMSTSPYHIASLLDKVRYVIDFWFVLLLALCQTFHFGVRTCASR